MKNGQKYIKEIQKMLNEHCYECALLNVRKNFDKPASCMISDSAKYGSKEFKEMCDKCLCESLEWLNQEYKDPILDDVEREYLSAVIKPFIKKISCIRKSKDPRKRKNYIKVEFCDDDRMFFPNLSNDEMYKGMELDRKYTLEELGLENVNG